jgi:hypothetical protein
VTSNAFRRIALSLPEATEGAHMEHPDFRVGGKIFASLGYPDSNWGVVKLTPEEQATFVGDLPDAFQPVKGGWGRRGNTQVLLKKVGQEPLRRAITAAWRNVVPKQITSKSNKPDRAQP